MECGEMRWNAKRAEGACGKAKCDGHAKRGKVAREVRKCREDV